MVALVLLPGLDGTGLLFADFAASFGPEVKVIVASYPTDTPLGYSELESVARTFLPQDQPFFLLAESFSGPIGIAIAASSPPGLLGLVLCCSFARNPVPMLAPLGLLVGAFPVAVLLKWSGTKAELAHKVDKMQGAIRYIMKKHREEDAQGQPCAHRQKKAQQAQTMRAHVAKIKAWLKDNDDKPGKSGGEKKSNITDNDSAKMKTSHGVLQGYDGVASRCEAPGGSACASLR